MNLNFKTLLKMKNTLKKREFFDKKYLIKSIGLFRDETLTKKINQNYVSSKFVTLYNYGVILELVKLGYVKRNKSTGIYLYHWNFNSRITIDDIDIIFEKASKRRSEILRLMKVNWQKRKQKILETPKLQIEHIEPTTQELFPEVKEVVMKEIEMPLGFQMWSPDEQARYLGLVPTKEEIQGWKDEIEYLKDELKNKIEALTRQQTANKSYKKRIFETEENLNQSLKIIKAQDNKIQGYENSLNSEKVSAESYKKRFEDAQKSLDEAKKVINEQEIAIEFFKQKKPFKSIKPKIEPKQVKYFKLFGYTIYEKN